MWCKWFHCENLESEEASQCVSPPIIWVISKLQVNLTSKKKWSLLSLWSPEIARRLEVHLSLVPCVSAISYLYFEESAFDHVCVSYKTNFLLIVFLTTWKPWLKKIHLYGWLWSICHKDITVLPSEGVSFTIRTESSPELSHSGLILRTLS